MHEQLISSHPAVKACILTGTGRYKPTLLVELQPGFAVTNKLEHMATIKLIWPKICEANNLADSMGRLYQDHISFVKPEKPFLISGKATMQRSATVKLEKEALDKKARS